MNPFRYERASDALGVIALLSQASTGTFIAGGTNLVDHVKLAERQMSQRASARHGRDCENRSFVGAFFSPSCGISNQPVLRIIVFHTALTCPVSAFSWLSRSIDWISNFELNN